VFTVILVVAALLVGHTSGYMQSRWSEWRLKRKLRPIPLPGKSREEHDTDEFLKVMHDVEHDDQTLVDYTINKKLHQHPIALSSRPYSTTDSMSRIREMLRERKLEAHRTTARR